jgi:hypothetical protein
MGDVMSESSSRQQIPVLVADYDASWISVDLSADPAAWAEAEAAERLARDGHAPKKRELRGYTDYLETMVRTATRVEDAMGLFLLAPQGDGKVVAAVRMVAVELEEGDDQQPIETARRIVAPDELPVVEPAEVSEIVSPAGIAVRGRTRIIGGSGGVTELLTYAWVFPGFRFAAALTTAFTDLVEAGRWRPAVDALAASVALAEPAS